MWLCCSQRPSSGPSSSEALQQDSRGPAGAVPAEWHRPDSSNLLCFSASSISILLPCASSSIPLIGWYGSCFVQLVALYADYGLLPHILVEVRDQCVHCQQAGLYHFVC
jgi:hypothetical protein